MNSSLNEGEMGTRLKPARGGRQSAEAKEMPESTRCNTCTRHKAHLLQLLKCDLVIPSIPLPCPSFSHTPVPATVAARNQVCHTAGLEEGVITDSGGDELRVREHSMQRLGLETIMAGTRVQGSAQRASRCAGVLQVELLHAQVHSLHPAKARATTGVGQ